MLVRPLPAMGRAPDLLSQGFKASAKSDETTAKWVQQDLRKIPEFALMTLSYLNLEVKIQKVYKCLWVS